MIIQSILTCPSSKKTENLKISLFPMLLVRGDCVTSNRRRQFFVTGVRQDFSLFYEYLRRCKYCPEPYSTPEEVAQHFATSHQFFLFLGKMLESTTYYLINKNLIVICLFDLTLNVWVNNFSVMSGWVFLGWTSI